MLREDFSESGFGSVLHNPSAQNGKPAQKKRKTPAGSNAALLGEVRKLRDSLREDMNGAAGDMHYPELSEIEVNKTGAYPEDIVEKAGELKALYGPIIAKNMALVWSIARLRLQYIRSTPDKKHYAEI